METSIQLRHPTGKKAVRMTSEKYETIRKILLSYFKSHEGVTHKGILKAMVEDFRRSKTRFPGSIEWHMEWVKLDLESRKVIRRVDNQFYLAN